MPTYSIPSFYPASTSPQPRSNLLLPMVYYPIVNVLAQEPSRRMQLSEVEEQLTKWHPDAYATQHFMTYLEKAQQKGIVRYYARGMQHKRWAELTEEWRDFRFC